MTTQPTRALRAVQPTDVRGPVTREPRGDETWCQANRAIYLTLLASPPPSNASAQRHDDYERYTDMARDWCASRCPQFAQCLHAALSGPGVDGFVAGTTETERNRLRETVGIEAMEMNMDHAAGVKQTKGCTFDIDATAAAIAAHPDDSNAAIAQRLGVTAVTVRRHRIKIAAAAKKAAEEASQRAAGEATEPPSPADTVDAWQQMFQSA